MTCETPLNLKLPVRNILKKLELKVKLGVNSQQD